MTEEEKILKRVENSIESVREYLKNDGGDVELIELSPENELKIRFTGACVSCNVNSMTFSGIKSVILSAVPEVKEVSIVE